MKTLKLYVWEDFSCDYTCGMVCVTAYNLTEARKIAKGYLEGYDWKTIAKERPKIITYPAIFVTYGGG